MTAIEDRPAQRSIETSETTQLAIETHGLRKVFGDVVAVDNLTLAVRRGEVFGFLGPNGAGKSTVVKMLTDLTRPTSGEGRLLGRPLGDREAKREIGYLPELFRFHDWLTASEFLDVHGRLAGMSRRERRERIPETLRLVGLEWRGDHRLRTFSKGMQQRAGLAQALLHRPGLVFLDEPTSALDPIGRRIVRDVIRELRAGGTTVFLNSHLLSEVELVCDRVAILNRGVVVAAGGLEDLMRPRVTVDLRLGRWSDAARAVLDNLGALEALDQLADGTARVSLALPAGEDVARLVRRLVEAGAEIYEVTPRRETLEDLFVNLVDQTDGMDVRLPRTQRAGTPTGCGSGQA